MLGNGPLQIEIQELVKQKENTLDYVEHLIRDAKYHLNLGHLKKLKKLLQGDNDEKDI